MNFDSKTGNLNLNCLNVNEDFTLSNLECVTNEEFKVVVENGDWVSYKLILDNEWICILQFYKEKIKWLNLFNSATPECLGLSVMQKIVEDWGGEKQYNWGTISLVNDMKANFSSIHINYKENH